MSGQQQQKKQKKEELSIPPQTKRMAMIHFHHIVSFCKAIYSCPNMKLTLRQNVLEMGLGWGREGEGEHVYAHGDMMSVEEDGEQWWWGDVDVI